MGMANIVVRSRIRKYSFFRNSELLGSVHLGYELLKTYCRISFDNINSYILNTNYK